MYAKDHLKINQTDLRWIVDSLNKQGVDTIVSCYQGCASCNCGVFEKTYVYWIDQGEFHFAKPLISNKSNKKTKTQYFILTGYQNSTSFFNFLIELVNQAKGETLNEGKFTVLNYSFEEVLIQIGSDRFNISLSDYDKMANLNKYHSIIIDKFLLYLSSYINLN